jgi:lipopolysaccharide export system ATP-binding protein
MPAVTRALSIEGLSVARGSMDILYNLSLGVEAGEILGVFGPSGAGKSTLFQAVVGELGYRGRVELGGRVVDRWPVWRRARAGLGYVPQGASVLFDLTVRENLRTFAALAGQTPEPERWARRVELGHRLDVAASALSGGERRRLELARALLLRPSVLLCDEPFAGLNPGSIEAVSCLLKEAAGEGVGVLLSDHHLELALGLTSRAVLLLEGRVAVETEAAAFATHPLVLERYVGKGPAEAGRGG